MPSWGQASPGQACCGCVARRDSVCAELLGLASRVCRNASDPSGLLAMKTGSCVPPSAIHLVSEGVSGSQDQTARGSVVLQSVCLTQCQADNQLLWNGARGRALRNSGHRSSSLVTRQTWSLYLSGPSPPVSHATCTVLHCRCTHTIPWMGKASTSRSQKCSTCRCPICVHDVFLYSCQE